MKTRKQKQEEALERQAGYTPNPKYFSIRQQVKAGTLNPKEVIDELVRVDPNRSPRLMSWLAGAGARRYDQAQNK